MRRRRSKSGSPGIRARHGCAAILRRNHGAGDPWRFASIELREPSKVTVRTFTPGDEILREAVVLCWSRDDGQVYKARVSLTDDRVLAWDR
jgi:primary-amine oxidase